MVYQYQKNAAGDFVCHICSAVKKNQSTMHYHLKRHEGKLPFQCPTCKREFLHASVLALHVAARHSRPSAGELACPVCPYKTLTKANRVLHFLRNHCAEDVAAFRKRCTTPLACAGCGKACNSPTAHLYHAASAGCLAPSCPQRQEQLAALLGPAAAAASSTDPAASDTSVKSQ